MYTAEEFADHRWELPEGGRWTELIEGEIKTYHPPDEIHGHIVLTVSKEIGKALNNRVEQLGYACHDLGLVVSRKPDTVRFPALSFYQGDARFYEFDKIISEKPPAWVVEVASTNDRRIDSRNRVQEYLKMGIDLIWIIDPHDQLVHCFDQSGAHRKFTTEEVIHAEPVFQQLKIPGEILFSIPHAE